MLPLAFQHWSGFRLYLFVALRGYRLYPLRKTYTANNFYEIVVKNQHKSKNLYSK